MGQRTDLLAPTLVFILVVYVFWIGLETVFLQLSAAKLWDVVSAGGFFSPVSYGRFSNPALQARIFAAQLWLGVLFVGGLILLIRGKQIRKSPVLGVLVSMAIAAGFLFFIFQEVAAGLGWGVVTPRMVIVAALAFPLPAALFVASIRTRIGNKIAATAVVAAIVAAPFGFGLSTMYPSPFIADFNYQNTDQLYASVAWGAWYLPGSATVLSNAYAGDYAYYASQAISHDFGKMAHYSNTIPTSLYQSSNLTYGFLLLDAETTSVVQAGLRAWTGPSPTEVARLGQDPKAAILYDNGEATIFVFNFDGGNSSPQT